MYCDTYGVQKPPTDLRIWVNEKNFDNDSESTGTNGSASMLRRTYGIVGFSTHSDVANFFINVGMVVPNNLLFNLCKFLQPDLTFGVETDVAGSDDVYAVAFHELSHASHWAKVGSNYWVKYINYIITYAGDNDHYGSGSGNNAGYCGVGEMWGNYFGNYVCANTRFGSSVNFTYGEDWYNPGFLVWSKTLCPDLTIPEIYGCLNATSINDLKTNLKTKTEYDSEIDEAYGFYSDWP